MDFLRFLEDLRTPALNFLFQLITLFGEETVFVLIGILFFWCIDKKKGYYLLSVGFLGIVCNQFLKISCRIPRPWILDENFTIVESARAQASGYSFPSGHTQAAAGTFGGIARFTEKKWIRIVCISLCILVPFSRMYLGVHTPKDVGVSLLIALTLVFALCPLMEKITDSRKGMRIFFGTMVLISSIFLLYLLFFPFPSDMDINNYQNAVENGCKIAGCILGIWCGYEIDAHLIHFRTEAVWWAQILKVLAGGIPILLMMKLLEEPLYVLCGESPLADGILYFLITLFASGIWPLTFSWFHKLGLQKNTDI